MCSSFHLSPTGQTSFSRDAEVSSFFPVPSACWCHTSDTVKISGHSLCSVLRSLTFCLIFLHTLNFILCDICFYGLWQMHSLVSTIMVYFDETFLILIKFNLWIGFLFQFMLSVSLPKQVIKIFSFIFF